MDEPEGPARVFRDQAPQRVNAVSDEMLVRAAQDQEHLEALRELGMRAGLVVPMTNRGHSVGLLTLVSAESGRTFSDEDVGLAGELGRRAATALENVQLYIERSNIAHTLQASLLPEQLPALPGWQAASLYRPAGDENRVGGDFYDVFELDRSWMLVVGDVTGRGAPAAALTALMRHTLRTAATLTGSTAAALGKLNRDLLKRSQLSLCTAVCLVLREGEQGAEADIICAGHPLPMLVRSGEAQPVGRSGVLLGAYPDERWKPVRVSIQPGDVLVLYSDGLVDAVGAQERFGPERLKLTLDAADGADDAVVRVEAALSGFEVGAQADDTAVLAVERLPVPEIRRVESLRAGAPAA
jgi:serine phosphatase RsbU (regulator of sigma subunit)